MTLNTHRHRLAALVIALGALLGGFFIFSSDSAASKAEGIKPEHSVRLSEQRALVDEVVSCLEKSDFVVLGPFPDSELATYVIDHAYVGNLDEHAADEASERCVERTLIFVPNDAELNTLKAERLAFLTCIENALGVDILRDSGRSTNYKDSDVLRPLVESANSKRSAFPFDVAANNKCRR